MSLPRAIQIPAEHAHQRPVHRLVNSKASRFVPLWGLHVLLGVTATAAPGMISTVHALLTILAGVAIAGSRAPLVRVAYAASYIVGAELFWRMAGARVFWETGKYALILVMIIALWRTRVTRIPAIPLFFIALLLPSSILTLEALPLEQARQQISFNLSGPFALFVGAWFFTQIKFSRTEFRYLLSIFLAPILTIAAYITLDMLSAGAIVWTTESNFQTSGGFGPNQISMILGLGAFAVWLLLALFGKQTLAMRMVLAALGVWLFAQGLLTFSRGGMLSATIAIAVFSVHLLSRPHQRVQFIYASVVIIPFIFLVLLPGLDEFTSGYLRARYQSLNATNRDQILQVELEVFTSNPLFGVGPGVGSSIRRAAAHTEYTRVLAEHGIPGIISLALLGFMIIRAYLKSENMLSRGVRGGAAIWGLTTMAHAAMRIAAMPFMLALVFAEYDIDE